MIIIVDLGANGKYVHFGKLTKCFLYETLYFSENLLNQSKRVEA